MRSLLLFFVCSVCCAVQCAELIDVFEWKQMPYAWDNDKQKREFVEDRLYIEQNNLPFSIQKWNHKLFVSLSRSSRGIASSLNYVHLNSTKKSPSLIPYPSWEVNKLPKFRTSRKIQSIRPYKKEEKIYSVYRPRVDSCDRLWLLDTGNLYDLENRQPVAKPKILIYNLKTDELVRKYELKPADYDENSDFFNIVVDDHPGSCDKTFLYILDSTNAAMVVYSFHENESWKVKHHFFRMDPLLGNYVLGGTEWQWDDGIFGGALGNINSDGFRTFYFHPLTRTKEFAVSTEVLQNETLATSASNYHYFKLLGERGENTHSSIHIFDPQTEVLFFTQPLKNGVACWNTKKPLNPENFHLFVQDDEMLVYPNDLFIDEDRYLWILTNRLPFFINNSLDPQHFNYRVTKINITDALKGTPCAEE